MSLITQRHLISRSGGKNALDALEDLDERIRTRRTIREVKNVVQPVAEAAQKAIRQVQQQTLVRIRALIREAEYEIKKQVKDKIDSMPALKGEDGYTPVKGKDYNDGNDGKPGENGKTPIAGKDYPTTQMMERFVAGMLTTFYESLKKDGLTPKQIDFEIKQLFKDIPAENIARALEGLSGSRKLSYKALKDTPSSQVGGVQHTLHRGGGSTGGKETYEYDLSDQCDGSTKTFSIPSNSRVVLVQSTDAPMGIYRKTVDWTGSGTTTLTLTSAVAAPTRGATFSILYVV